MALQRLVAIVDDDDWAREALLSLVQALGFEARAFCGAADYLASGLAAETGCLIADLRMPGVDGLELYRRLSAAGVSPPAILISAQTDEASRAAALRAGFRACLAKPLLPDSLLGAIQGALAQRERNGP